MDELLADDDLYNAAIGHRLKVALAEASLTQAELAQRAGVSANTVNRHVTGHTIPVSALRRYGLALGVDPRTLLPRVPKQAADSWAPSDSNRQPTGDRFVEAEFEAVAS